MASTDGRNRGFALLTVLGAMTMLVWLAGASGHAARDAIALAAGQTAFAQAEEAAESGIWIAAVALDRALREGDATPSFADPISVGDAAVAVSWRDLMRRVEINNAGADALAAGASAAGLSDPEAVAMAGQIASMRRMRSNGTLSWRLPPRAFHEPGDLLGELTPEEWRRLAPHFTFHRLPDPTFGTRLVEIVSTARMPGGAAADRYAMLVVGAGPRVLEWGARR